MLCTVSHFELLNEKKNTDPTIKKLEETRRDLERISGNNEILGQVSERLRSQVGRVFSPTNSSILVMV